MIESLFSLFVQMLIVVLLPALVLALINFRTSFIDDTSFLQELMAKEIAYHLHEPQAKIIGTNHQVLKIKSGLTTYRYYIQNHKLIKQVDSKGNITVLNGVKHIKFIRISTKNLKIIITFLEGNSWIEKTFII
ncbi:MULTISPECIES: competence type IV pilus minor pilin ComGF [unclassified Staphylococcus]|uniref:competence type IV pilus minor pilin ComGF n=1 Tax=unclassified Staphylococcus TaxID=91994 RepID=UPI0021CE7D1A|nr:MULTISPECIES: competence type IV pilus minor pilin ComGF [unclassified Staphylococcus]UXR79313.1 hypothetical protein MUA92_05335 [Staphylococcus sp. IVB6227]UXR81564.1 hypothetical protein MUA51_05575 [Staphylococcus sp. IVB6214]